MILTEYTTIPEDVECIAEMIEMIEVGVMTITETKTTANLANRDRKLKTGPPTLRINIKMIANAKTPISKDRVDGEILEEVPEVTFRETILMTEGTKPAMPTPEITKDKDHRASIAYRFINLDNVRALIGIAWPAMPKGIIEAQRNADYTRVKVAIVTEVASE